MPPKKKKSGGKGKGQETSQMFPSLHAAVTDAVTDAIHAPIYHPHDTDAGTRKTYSTHVMGRFTCFDKSCSNSGWGSKKITILIRMYNKHNGIITYNAVVFSQRCKQCKQLGCMILYEDSYVERVAYRLKKWSGVQVEEQPRGEKKGKPHESWLCEGCKRRVCREGD